MVSAINMIRRTISVEVQERSFPDLETAVYFLLPEQTAVTKLSSISPLEGHRSML